MIAIHFWWRCFFIKTNFILHLNRSHLATADMRVPLYQRRISSTWCMYDSNEDGFSMRPASYLCIGRILKTRPKTRLRLMRNHFWKGWNSNTTGRSWSNPWFQNIIFHINELMTINHIWVIFGIKVREVGSLYGHIYIFV